MDVIIREARRAGTGWFLEPLPGGPIERLALRLDWRARLVDEPRCLGDGFQRLWLGEHLGRNSARQDVRVGSPFSSGFSRDFPPMFPR